ncbi:MAG: DUF2281 domain-containing protein [Longimicrobiales bacterium]|nr:DUF2281 domain-containing protein [Longimicrobiales bacterium]
MEDVTRKRILRKLEQLPEDRLYQVLDYIEFLELKYARAAGRKPDAFQQFAERVEDQMRVRSVAPKAMKGTMRVMSTAGKVLDGVRSLGRDLVAPPDQTGVSVGRRGADADGSGAGRAGGKSGATGGTEPSTEPDGTR